jgi:NAD+ synthase (glutamine-hydrolysing)
LLECKSFEADSRSFDILRKKDKKPEAMAKIASENTWENLFKARLHTKPLALKKLSNEDCAEVFSALGFGIQDYAAKNKLQNFCVALSGGVDSALVLTLMKLHLKPNQTLEAVFMPGHFSATLSYDLCVELTKNLGVPLKVMPIKFLHNNIKMQYRDIFGEDLQGLADENIQSRLRGALIYTRANAKNCMVLNTSNKSEIAVGYTTMYGDAVGALSVLGDLFKGEVYDLCHYINQNYNAVIPKDLIERAPSAELRDNQKDEDSLLPYPELDALLEGICSGEFSTTELVKLGFDQKAINKIYRLYENSEYKRKQFCPILKLKSKSFGHGHRVPISKHSLI